MKFIRFNIFILVVSLILGFQSCSNDGDDDSNVDNFDRKEMLNFWANDIIIPAFEAYEEKLNALVQTKDNFVTSKTESEFQALRSAWLEAYKVWQHVSMFDIGKAEEIGYRNFVNIYPCDVEELEEFVNGQNYNLTLPSTFDTQGFPALDYLLFGLSDDSSEQLDKISEENYTQYLSELVDRLKALNDEVLSDWRNLYLNEFINNNGSSASASTDKMVNDFLFYYEKFFRAGKIGIPAGVFSGNASSQLVEAPYSGIYSKELFLEAFSAVEAFFNGKSFDRETTGSSLKQYLDYLKEVNNSEDIAKAVNDQWVIAHSTAENKLLDSFKQQVEQDNIQMLAVYDEVQKAVVLMKVDMMQALNIQVDFVDADGD